MFELQKIEDHLSVLERGEKKNSTILESNVSINDSNVQL